MSSAMNNSTESLVLTAEEQRQYRWSVSTVATAHDMETARWDAPPIPPIPTNEEEEAWRRRSNKRLSYTSQMSGRTNYTATTMQQLLGAAPESKTARPISDVSNASSFGPRQSQRDSRTTRRTEPDAHAELHWEVNALNPHNWTSRKRWMHTLTAGSVTFIVTLASSIVAPAQQAFKTRFPISTPIATLPFALYVLGLALGPLISRPCSEVVGRKVIYTAFFPLFALFTLAAGFVHTSSGFIVCRFLAGVSASPALSVGCQMVSDLWKPQERTMPWAFYYSMPLFGPAIGMVLGGFITQDAGSRWNQYVTVLFFAACIVPVVFMSETSKSIILRRKQKTSARIALGRDAFVRAVVDPPRLLFTGLTISMLSMYSGFNFAVLYASFVAFPRVFSAAYSFDLGAQGLTFISMVVGVVVGLSVLALHHTFVYQPRVTRWRDAQAAEAEKAQAAKRRTNRSSYQSTFSTYSRPKLKHNNSHTSFGSTLKRITTGGSKAGTTVALPVADHERNVSLAITAANYLNGVPANEGKRIMPERVQLLLSRHLAFGDLCVALEAYQLQIDRVHFAKVLVDALPVSALTGSSMPNQEPNGLARSQSLHRAAAAAALNAPMPLASPPIQSWPLPSPTLPLPMPHRPALVVAQNGAPPPEWRLWPALPASVLLTGSLFMFGWTARQTVHWGVPCLAMGVFAFSVLLVFVTTQMYLADRYGARDGASALAGALTLRYLMSFAFAMFAVQMYDALGAGWATSVFALISLALGTVPWVIVLVGNARRKGAG